MSSKQTYPFFFYIKKENYDIRPKKKKDSSHAQNMCDEASSYITIYYFLRAL